MNDFFASIHNRIIVGVALFLLLIVILASCHSTQPQVVYSQNGQVVDPGYAQQPQVVQGQAPVIVNNGGGNHDGFFTGLMMGHMMGGGFGSHTTTVVHAPAPVYVRPAVPAPRYVAPAPVYRPAQTPVYNTAGRSSITTTRSPGRISVGRRR